MPTTYDGFERKKNLQSGVDIKTAGYMLRYEDDKTGLDNITDNIRTLLQKIMAFFNRSNTTTLGWGRFIIVII